jgi:DNA transformation protein and related proteins
MPRAKSKASKSRSAKAASAKRQSGSTRPTLLGLGPVSLRILRAAGITTRADLERLGPVRAYIAAKQIEPRVTLNLLWGIAGAVTDTHWTKLPAEYRSTLLLDYDAHLDAARSLAAPSNKSLERTRGR